MSEFLLTVIIPVYNQERLVIKALDSIPERDDVEILVIDDGSTDNTWNSLMSYRANDNRNIVYLYNIKNQGVSYTLNKGLMFATGKYVVILGSDDYFYTKEFEEVLPELENDYDLIFFDMKINDGSIIKSTPEHQPHGSVKFMKRDFIGDIRNREDKLAGEDYYFYKELLAKNPKVKYTNKAIKHYNYPREGSLSDLVLQGKIEGVEK